MNGSHLGPQGPMSRDLGDGGAVHVVVLAAGKGTRMRSARPKVLHRAAGLALVEWVLRVARSIAPESITVVVGHESAAVRSAIEAPDVQFAVQDPQRGTGHALLQARSLLENRTGRVLLLSGDVPLLTSESVRQLLHAQRASEAAALVATAIVEDPTGYGRVLRNGDQLDAIVEHRDATPDQLGIREINSGVYVFAVEGLFRALADLSSNNAQGEYYLPDLIKTYRKEGRIVQAIALSDPDEIRGINTLAELAEVGKVLRQRINHSLMADGVTLVDPDTAYIGPDVRLGADTVIHPAVILEGNTTIGKGCQVHAGTRVVDSHLADRVTVLDHCLVVDSTLEEDSSIGPFARIRPGSTIGAQAHVGNFVEIKKSSLGSGTKVGHLSYLGDSTVGVGVNVGAGTITCNYDGQRKHRTVVMDGAFVGSDSTLVAPVTIGRGAYIAAGSSITEDVPDGALGIARSRQANKDGWAKDRSKKS
jgi:bifunctional UDP-N-acetylglucosamine pyrophosphorylase / glucosamine-1-phosphate N-acetyltransferase